MDKNGTYRDGIWVCRRAIWIDRGDGSFAIKSGAAGACADLVERAGAGASRGGRVLHLLLSPAASPLPC